MNQREKTEETQTQGKPIGKRESLEELGESTEKPSRTFAVFREGIEPPLVSVCVMCYKNVKLLKGMLDSILEQDYPKIELIVSDDGSNDFDVDDVRNYIEEKKDVNIGQVIVRKNAKNQGTVKHVSEVLKIVKGQYVVLTAADDRYNDTHAFTCCVKKFLEHPAGQWLVARCNLLTPDYQRSVGYAPAGSDVPYFESADAGLLYSRWSRRSLAVPCSMMFRAEAFSLAGGIDLSYRYLEDWPLVLKLLRNGFAPLFLDKVICIHGTSGITNTSETYGIETRKAFYQDKYHLMEQEVEPYLDRLTEEDRMCLKTYRREIMDRNFFLDIDRNQMSRKAKIQIAARSPHKLVWLLERKYDLMWKNIKCKDWLIATQLLLLCGAFLLACAGWAVEAHLLLRLFGWVELAAAIVSLAICGAFCALKVHCYKKSELRRKLVN